jgi:hypothetical protein
LTGRRRSREQLRLVRWDWERNHPPSRAGGRFQASFELLSGRVSGELVACLLGMMRCMQLARLVAVMHGMEMVGMCNVGMVAGFLMMALRMRFGCCVVVLGRVFMVRGGLPVVIDLFLVRHVLSVVEVYRRSRFRDRPGPYPRTMASRRLSR